MAHTLSELSPAALRMLSEYHLGTLATQRADGTPHVVAVGFTVDTRAGLARVITRAGSQKAVNAARGGRAVVTEVDGPRWLSFEGEVSLHPDAGSVREAERRYARRYRRPRPAADRVAVQIRIDRVLGSGGMFLG